MNFKKKLNKIFSGRKIKPISNFLLILKVSVFAFLILTSLFMYYLGDIWIGNDLIIIAAIYILFNKADNII